MVTTIIVLLSLTGITKGNTLSSWIQTNISIPFFLPMGFPAGGFYGERNLSLTDNFPDNAE
jgi:hypothetical protein